MSARAVRLRPPVAPRLRASLPLVGVAEHTYNTSQPCGAIFGRVVLSNTTYHTPQSRPCSADPLTAGDGEAAAQPKAVEAAPPGQEPGRKAAKSSHFRGVTLFKPTMKWRAQARILYPFSASNQRPPATTIALGVTATAGKVWLLLQISAGGKTTSLGDHDTEEEAARAFDRAAINKAGVQAKTNFSVQDYKAEIEDLQGAFPFLTAANR